MSHQIPMFEPETSWAPPEMSSLPDWAGADKVCIDAETRDEKLRELGIGVRRDGYSVGWSFTLEKNGEIGKSYYLPMRHSGGDNLDEQQVISYLKSQAASFTGEVVGANLQYDLDYLFEEGVTFPQVKFYRDIQIADPLIYELHFSYSLKNIGERVGVDSKDEDHLNQAARDWGVSPKHGLWILPARHVGAYAENDTRSPLIILQKQQKLITEKGLQQVFDLESELLPILVKMRRRGVLIDQDKLTAIEDWSLSEEAEALKLVKDQTGYDIGIGNVWKADALAQPLEAIGMEIAKTPKTGKPSIENAILEKVDHPVAKAIRHARKVNRLRTTFAASIRRYLVAGRIHTTFNQIAREDEVGDQKGVRYGRLSSVHPNLQQQPSKDRDPVIASEWRKIFIPEPGCLWSSNDYSQQEPRWTTHYAALMKLERAEEAAERYRNHPDTDNHDMMTRLIHTDEFVDNLLESEGAKGTYKVLRSRCKNIFLGVCYGEGGAKLCRDIDLPTRWALRLRDKMLFFDKKYEAQNARAELRDGYIFETAGEEGQDILDRFDEEVPFVRQLANKAKIQGNTQGYIRTILNRRLHFPELPNGSYDWAHKALNRIIQGTSADQTKRAIIDIDNEGHFIQLQVHDETNGSYADEKEALRVGEIMENCVSNTLVPFKVDTEVGPSWGEVREIS